MVCDIHHDYLDINASHSTSVRRTVKRPRLQVQRIAALRGRDPANRVASANSGI